MAAVSPCTTVGSSSVSLHNSGYAANQDILRCCEVGQTALHGHSWLVCWRFPYVCSIWDCLHASHHHERFMNKVLAADGLLCHTTWLQCMAEHSAS